VSQAERRVKVHAGASDVLPDPAADFDSVRQGWERSRSEPAIFLDGLSPEQLTLGVFRHP